MDDCGYLSYIYILRYEITMDAQTENQVVPLDNRIDLCRYGLGRELGDIKFPWS